MRTTKLGGTLSKQIQPNSINQHKRRSPKTSASNHKLTHFFFVLRNGKQLHQLTNYSISATVKVHPNLSPITSAPVACHHSQADFQFAFSIDLTGSNVIENPELFSPKITISINDFDRKEDVGAAIIPPLKSKILSSNGRPLIYLINHQDVSLKLLSSPKIGGFVNVTCAFGPSSSASLIDSTSDFIDLTVQQLQKVPQPECDWEADAVESGWVPPEKAAALWQKLARENGWRLPDDFQLSIETRVVGQIAPVVPDNADLISFSSDDVLEEPQPDVADEEGGNDAKPDLNENLEDFVNFALASKYVIQNKVVFERRPIVHSLSPLFTVVEMAPKWQPNDSDTDLNRDLTNLITEAENNDLYEFQNYNSSSPKFEKKK